MDTTTRCLLPLALSAGALVTGCALPLEGAEQGALGDERTAATADALTVENALMENGIFLNGIFLNGIFLNALQMNALAPPAKGSLQDPGPDGALARHVMKYIASCALGPDDAFDFSWVDADGVQHTESYPGQIGLVSHWADEAISEEEARWVSACLLSRVNRYGTSVVISSRGHHGELKKADTDEIETFDRREGAFWGNLFSTTPEAYACFDPDNVDHARQQQRACAAGHLDGQGSVIPCAMIQIVGSCEDACKKDKSNLGYYWKCRAGEGAPRTKDVITVFLD